MESPHKAFRSSRQFSLQNSALSLLSCLIVKSYIFRDKVNPLVLFLKSNLWLLQLFQSVSANCLDFITRNLSWQDKRATSFPKETMKPVRQRRDRLRDRKGEREKHVCVCVCISIVLILLVDGASSRATKLGGILAGDQPTSKAEEMLHFFTLPQRISCPVWRTASDIFPDSPTFDEETAFRLFTAAHKQTTLQL